jgi:hypothetical protein
MIKIKNGKAKRGHVELKWDATRPVDGHVGRVLACIRNGGVVMPGYRKTWRGTVLGSARVGVKARIWEAIKRASFIEGADAGGVVVIREIGDVPSGYCEVDAVGNRLRSNKAISGFDSWEPFIQPVHNELIGSGEDSEFARAFYACGMRENRDWVDAQYEYRVYVPKASKGAIKMYIYQENDIGMYNGDMVLAIKIDFYINRAMMPKKVYVMVVDRHKKAAELVG